MTGFYLLSAVHAKATAPAISTNALVVAAVSGWLIPALVDFALKANVPTAIKTGVATVLSALAGVIPTVVFAPGEKWSSYLLATIVAFVNTQAAHRTMLGLGDPVQRLTGGHGLHVPARFAPRPARTRRAPRPRTRRPARRSSRR